MSLVSPYSGHLDFGSNIVKKKYMKWQFGIWLQLKCVLYFQLRESAHPSPLRFPPPKQHPQELSFTPYIHKQVCIDYWQISIYMTFAVQRWRVYLIHSEFSPSYDYSHGWISLVAASPLGSISARHHSGTTLQFDFFAPHRWHVMARFLFRRYGHGAGRLLLWCGSNRNGKCLNLQSWRWVLDVMAIVPI